MFLGKHTIIKLIFLILAVLALSSCSADGKAAMEETIQEEAAENDEIVSSLEVGTRELLYVYEEGPDNITSREVVLKLNSEPLLLAGGYVRLAGVVSGGRPIALIEVGGRARLVEIRDEVGKYEVARIVHDELTLIKKEAE